MVVFFGGSCYSGHNELRRGGGFERSRCRRQVKHKSCLFVVVVKMFFVFRYLTPVVASKQVIIRQRKTVFVLIEMLFCSLDTKSFWPLLLPR
jgi:hypothetical protein